MPPNAAKMSHSAPRPSSSHSQPSSESAAPQSPSSHTQPSSVLATPRSSSSDGLPLSVLGAPRPSLLLGQPSSGLGARRSYSLLRQPSSVLGPPRSSLLLGQPSSVLGAPRSSSLLGQPSSELGAPGPSTSHSQPSSVLAVLLPSSLHGQPSSGSAAPKPSSSHGQRSSVVPVAVLVPVSHCQPSFRSLAPRPSLHGQPSSGSAASGPSSLRSQPPSGSAASGPSSLDGQPSSGSAALPASLLSPSSSIGFGSVALPNAARVPLSAPLPSSRNPPPTSSAHKKRGTQPKVYVCSFCPRRFFTRQSRYSHQKKKHAGQMQTTKAAPPRHAGYQCQTCDMSAASVRDLVNHYRRVHQRDHQISYKAFPSEEQFLQWKKETEKSTFSQYVKTSGDRRSAGTITNYYYCHRSGSMRTVKVTDRKRSLKSQGSCKSGKKCISYMTSRKNLLTGTVHVEYCLDHIGHKIQLCHLKISDEVRHTIAAKLAQGLEFNNILTEVRDTLTGANRDALLTRKDIRNIEKQFKISWTQRHANDKISVDLWVSELSRDVDNPVIYYKSQGNEHEFLKDEDMLLCLQTNFQKDMLLKCHSKIICADHTHKTTECGFFLTSILVLDDHEEPIPVAWALSNRQGGDILKLFLGAVRDNCCHDLPTQIFMSDLAGNFYNAWCDVFSKPDKRQYSSWHVDKSWRRQIQHLLSGSSHKQTQSLLYAYLKKIQSEPDETEFYKMLQEFLSYLSVEAPDFLDYFSKNYVHDHKTVLWASCFSTLANANMYSEAFHQTLKTFNRKQNKRVDNLLFVLLKLARDKAVEHLIKSEKSKITQCVREIRKRHQIAQGVRPEDICNVGKGEWTVSPTGVNYNINRISTDDICGCKLFCDLCNACVHMYTCTCSDYLINTVICKHIHAVHMLNNTSQDTSVPHQNDNESDFDTEETDVCKTIVCQEKSEKSFDLKKVKSAALSAAGGIIQFIKDTTDISLAQTACTQLTDLLGNLRGIQTLPSVDSRTVKKKKKRHLRNKNVEKQPGFISSKSKLKNTGRDRRKLKKH